MFGYRREELIGLSVDSLVPPDVRTAHHGLRAGYQRAPQTRPMAERTRLAGLRKDGATLPVEISLSPVPTASETFVLAVIRDATQPERRSDLAELALDAAAGKGRIYLLDRVVRHLFQVGLSLQTAAGLPAGVVRERLATALDELDVVIREVRDYAFTSGGGADPAPLEPSLAGDLSGYLGEEAADGPVGDAAQYGPIEHPAHRTERRPVGAGHRHDRALPGGGEREVGVQNREQGAARAGGHPAQRQPGRLVGAGQLADLDADQLGDTSHADPGQAGTVGVLRCPGERPVLAEPGQPLPGDGEADIQPHLVTYKHP